MKLRKILQCLLTLSAMNVIADEEIFTQALDFLEVGVQRDEQLCNKKREKECKSLPLRKTMSRENRLGFTNYSKGIDEKGACWWVSRFHRKLLQQVTFDPAGKSPNEKEMKRLVRTILTSSKQITIPGYKNIRSFTQDQQSLIIPEINRWMFNDNIKVISKIISRPFIEINRKKANNKSMKDVKTQLQAGELPFLYEYEPIGSEVIHARIVIDSTDQPIEGKFFTDKKFRTCQRVTYYDSNYEEPQRQIYCEDFGTMMEFKREIDSKTWDTKEIYVPSKNSYRVGFRGEAKRLSCPDE